MIHTPDFPGNFMVQKFYGIKYI